MTPTVAGQPPCSVVVGVSQDALDALSASLFAQAQSINPGPFCGTVEIATLGVTSATWSIDQAPTFVLSPGVEHRAWLRARVEREAHGHRHAAAAAAYLADDAVVFAANAAQVSGSLLLADGSTMVLSGSLSTSVQARTGPGVVILEAVGSRFVPSGPIQPGLQWVLDQIVVPQIQASLNQLYANGFVFDLFDNDLLNLSPPGIAIDGQWLLAFSAQGATVPAPPPPGTRWPSASGFALAKRNVLEGVLSTYLQRHNTGKSGSASASIGPISLGADYGVGLTALNAGQAQSGTLGGSAVAGGSGRIWAQLKPFPRTTFGLGITANPDFVMQLNRQDETLTLVPVSITGINLELQLFTVPPWVTYITENIIDWLAQPISPLIVDLVRQAPLPSVDLPVDQLVEGRVTSTWSIGPLALAECRDAAGEDWLGLVGAPQVTCTVAPPVESQAVVGARS